MVSLTATLFKSIVNDTDADAENIENLIDLAITEIQIHSGVDLPLMDGTAGSKTVSLENKEYAAVMEATRAIYYSFFKGVETSTVGGMTVSSPDLKSNPNVQAAIIKAARRLAEFDCDHE